MTEQNKECESKQTEVETLREQLRQAELEEAITTGTQKATLCGINTSTNGRGEIQLGPSVTAEV